MTPHWDSIRDVTIIHFPVTETAPDEFPVFILTAARKLLPAILYRLLVDVG